MRTEPRTEAGKRYYASLPKANMEKVAAYEASPKAKVDKWLAFESDYLNMLRERKELGADW